MPSHPRAVTGLVREVRTNETELPPVRPPDDTPGRAGSNEADLAAHVFWPSRPPTLRPIQSPSYL